MKIKTIERGLILSSFECDLCDKEVELEELWSVKVEGRAYRIHICSDCLVKEVEKEKSV